jgi:hypothetical protein
VLVLALAALCMVEFVWARLAWVWAGFVMGLAGMGWLLLGLVLTWVALGIVLSGHVLGLSIS